MEVKVAFAAGLFCVVFSMFGSSQNIQDGVVYTEVKKTLVNGTTGILRCRFKGDPNAVYWKKGSDPENAPSIISWTYGIKFGPRYKDGSCNIDENFSLVIRNLRNADAGRYICQVSNYKGILIDNYTDVTITDVALQTKSAVTLQEGQTATVPCQVNIRPKKVSWVRRTNETLVFIDMSHELIEKSGPGYKGGLFNITKEYSLVIYDVTIQHEDNYSCVVSDYDTGNVYHDATVLTVFAYPREPFPVIEECLVNSSSSCTLRISSDTILTCRVDEYYPEMDLHFVRGSERVKSLETKIWNNSDGTKNKRIRITADGGTDKSFECVATGFVGQALSRSMTIHLIRDDRQSSVAVAVLIPVILLSTIIIIAIYVMKRRKRHLKQKYGKVPMLYTAKQHDLISYIELWTLVKYAREQNLSDKLGRVLDKPIKDEEGSKTSRTDENYYQEFCRWKSGYTGKCQREDFFDACMNAGLKSAIDELQKYSDSNRAVTVDDLEHTLWHISESDLIIGLLEHLGGLHETLAMLKDKGKREVVEGAMTILKHWRDVNSSGNQEVMLSLALESIKYTPSDKDFFRIPDDQTCGLDKNEIQAFLLSKISSRHCTELINATMEFRKEHHVDIALLGSNNRDVWIDNIIEQNRTALFDSHQLIEDWWAEQNCSNHEKRCRLWRAANEPNGKKDEKVVQARPKPTLIYKAELVDLAFDMIIEDFRPLADALGVPRSKFTSYRQDFRSSHLGLGTISLLLTLVKLMDSTSLFTPNRRILSSILDKAGYPNAMKRFNFAFEPSYGELFAIATAVVEDDKTKGDVEVVKEPIDDIKNEIKRNLAVSLREKDLHDLQRMLELTDEDIPDINMASVLTLLKIWKDRVCPGLVDHRVVLAEGLQKINKPLLADAVINGQYQSRETSIDFIQDMLDGMDGSRRTTLKRLLQSEQDKKKWLQSSDITSQWICDCLVDWIKEMESSVKNHLKDLVREKNTAEIRRDFNDDLVDHGFFDLAREIMNIEQVL